MQVSTFEGIVKNGQILLTEDVGLPESSKVYVTVPDLQRRKARILSPRVVDKEKLKDFKREIVKFEDDNEL